MLTLGWSILERIMKYKVVVFDFDGTLVNSNEVKVNAYYKAFAPFTEEKEVIANVLSQYPELNRYDTIKKILINLSNYINYDDVLERYNTQVLDDVKNAFFLEGAINVLNFLVNSKVDLYLSSNTPLDILLDIIKHKKIDSYFIGISGYPANKNEYLRNIIASNKYKASDYLVVGDGKSDENSAKENNTDFYLVENNSLQKLYNKLVTSEV